MPRYVFNKGIVQVAKGNGNLHRHINPDTHEPVVIIFPLQVLPNPINDKVNLESNYKDENERDSTQGE